MSIDDGQRCLLCFWVSTNTYKKQDALKRQSSNSKNLLGLQPLHSFLAVSQTAAVVCVGNGPGKES